MRVKTMSKGRAKSERVVDARKFQKQLGSLANTLALKVEREAPKLVKPIFAAADICVMLRQSLSIYELFCFINADDRRKKDPDWKPAYSAAILPLIRCMIDCLYNITLILKRTGPMGYQFRENGYKWALKSLDDDCRRYGGDPAWDSYTRRMRDVIHHSMAADGITPIEVQSTKPWLTLSAYLRDKSDPSLAPHKAFLRELAFVFWKEYSSMAHAAFNGLLLTALYYNPDIIPHEHREHFDTVVVERMIAVHVSRTAGLLLCTLTEVQAYFHFDDAHIDQRLHAVWKALLPVPEIKELHKKRYKKLMREKGINP